MFLEYVSNRRDSIISIFIRSAIYYLLFGSFLNNYLLIGGHYIYLIIVLIVVLLLSIRKSINVLLVVYLSVVIFMTYYTYVIGLNDGYSFYASIIYYFAIPLVFGRSSLFVDEIYYKKTLYSILIIVLPNALVVLLQLQDLYHDIFPIEYTSILGIAQKRYTGVLGGALMNGLVSGICVVVSFYKIIEGEKNKYFYIFILLSSLFTLLLSYSRGSYVFVIIAIFFIMYKKKNIVRIKNNYIYFLLFIIIFLTQFADEMVFHRLISVVNFNEEGNALRVFYWNKAFEVFLGNVWLGVGLGTISSVGSHEYSVANSGEAMLAESYFLKLMAEGGVFMMISFIFIVYIALKNSIKSKKEFIFPALFIALNVEAMILTSLEAPIISIFYWIVCGYLLSQKSNVYKEGSSQTLVENEDKSILT